jgi:hypothetical protein
MKGLCDRNVDSVGSSQSTKGYLYPEIFHFLPGVLVKHELFDAYHIVKIMM